MICLSFQFFLSFLATLSTFVYAAPSRHRGATVKGIGVPVSNSDASNIIANRYIVVYNNNATDDAVSVHQASVMNAMRKRSLGARNSSGRKLSNKMQAFSMSGWRGMTIDAEDSMILEIESANEVGLVSLSACISLLKHKCLGCVHRGRYCRQVHCFAFTVECSSWFR
jgi:hypothetical protein